jgi:hypothetical protein
MESSNQMFSADLVAGLNQLEESPWGNFDGRPFDTRKLASLLKPYGIHPKTVRKDEVTKKGYHRVDFHDAWSRYLPVNDLLSVTTVTPDTTQLQNECPDYPSQTPEKDPFVTDKSQSYVQANVTDVTDKTPKTGEEREKQPGWEMEFS